MEYIVSRIYPDDIISNNKQTALLAAEGLRRDTHLDYSCGIFDADDQLIATGSCFADSLRCLAVDKNYRGLGLLNIIVGHLIEIQNARGNNHIFLYTKVDSGHFFSPLGFYEISRVKDKVIFMENKSSGFSKYINNLKHKVKQGRRIGSIVMNANPFTLGHLSLIEKASQECDFVHIFIVSEESGIFPFSVRDMLIRSGTQHLRNIIFHSTGSYIISNATFPSYFQKEHNSIIIEQASLDVTVFSKIARALNISCRYVGQEPYSSVTRIYNEVMKTDLPALGIELIEIERTRYNDTPISASLVRNSIKTGNLDSVKAFLPDSTFSYLISAEAKPIIDKIKRADNVIHY